VTKEYVDREARLRNLSAQETQYLGIMKRATTVKDTLEVSEKLSQVRGQIEQQQAEFAALSKQIETVAIAVTLHAEADAKIFGLHWRPLYALKVAARDGVEALANYTSAMIAAIFRLPAFLLWIVTIVAFTVISWRGTRWIWRAFFAAPQKSQ
jgi:aspartate oxidase